MTTSRHEPYVLITRPDPAGKALAEDLSAAVGAAHVVHSPLMKLRFSDSPVELHGISRLIFTSQNGVESFTRVSPRRDIPCLTVGTRTAAKARDAGLTAEAIGEDVAELITALSQNPPKGRCLYIRGQHIRTDLNGALASSGIHIRDHIGYAQDALELTAAAQKLLLREVPVVIPLYSPRSARLLFKNQPIKAKLFICAISDFVVANLPQVRKLMIAPRPDGEAMRRCTLELIGDVKRLEANGTGL